MGKPQHPRLIGPRLGCRRAQIVAARPRRDHRRHGQEHVRRGRGAAAGATGRSRPAGITCRTACGREPVCRGHGCEPGGCLSGRHPAKTAVAARRRRAGIRARRFPCRVGLPHRLSPSGRRPRRRAERVDAPGRRGGTAGRPRTEHGHPRRAQATALPDDGVDPGTDHHIQALLQRHHRTAHADQADGTAYGDGEGLPSSPVDRHRAGRFDGGPGACVRTGRRCVRPLVHRGRSARHDP